LHEAAGGSMGVSRSGCWCLPLRNGVRLTRRPGTANGRQMGPIGAHVRPPRHNASQKRRKRHQGEVQARGWGPSLPQHGARLETSANGVRR
jgi:hypothetical protein